MGFGGFGPPQGSAGGAESVGSADAIQVADGAGAFVARWPLSAIQMEAADGSEAAPSIASTNHTDTGIAWDIGSAGDLDLVVDGALNMRLKVDHTNALQPFIPIMGTVGAPGLVLGNALDCGIWGTAGNFQTAIQGLRNGWRVTKINSSPLQCAVHFDDHQASPLVCVSFPGGYNSESYDFDTGPSIHVGGTTNECSIFTNGVERVKYRAGGAIDEAPALANSTGIVHEAAAVQTADATVTSLYSKTLADNTCYVFDVLVTCRDTGGTERAAYARRVRVHRQGAGAATLGTIEAPYTDESLASMNCTFTVSSNDIRVSVTGKAGTTINMAAQVTSIGAE